MNNNSNISSKILAIKKQAVSKKILAFIIVIILLTGNYFLKKGYEFPYIKINAQETAININTNFLKIVSLGNYRLISGLLWIKTLLDSDLEHYKEKDLNSWMFLRFKAISELDPKFYQNYLYGGLYLSIVKDDKQGAKYIYDRGIKRFPYDYELLKNIAFHYHFELGDPEEANDFYYRLLKHPSTPIMYHSLYARAISGQGDLQEAFNLLHETYLKLGTDNAIKIRLHSYLYAIKAELDLNCLNHTTSKCDTLDFDTNPYIKKNNKYEAQKTWEPFRLKR